MSYHSTTSFNSCTCVALICFSYRKGHRFLMQARLVCWPLSKTRKRPAMVRYITRTTTTKSDSSLSSNHPPYLTRCELLSIMVFRRLDNFSSKKKKLMNCMLFKCIFLSKIL